MTTLLVNTNVEQILNTQRIPQCASQNRPATWLQRQIHAIEKADSFFWLAQKAEDTMTLALLILQKSFKSVAHDPGITVLLKRCRIENTYFSIKNLVAVDGTKLCKQFVCKGDLFSYSVPNLFKIVQTACYTLSDLKDVIVFCTERHLFGAVAKAIGSISMYKPEKWVEVLCSSVFQNKLFFMAAFMDLAEQCRVIARDRISIQDLLSTRWTVSLSIAQDVLDIMGKAIEVWCGATVVISLCCAFASVGSAFLKACYDLKTNPVSTS